MTHSLHAALAPNQATAATEIAPSRPAPAAPPVALAARSTHFLPSDRIGAPLPEAIRRKVRRLVEARAETTAAARAASDKRRLLERERLHAQGALVLAEQQLEDARRWATAALNPERAAADVAALEQEVASRRATLESLAAAIETQDGALERLTAVGAQLGRLVDQLMRSRIASDPDFQRELRIVGGGA